MQSIKVITITPSAEFYAESESNSNNEELNWFIMAASLLEHLLRQEISTFDF